MAGNKTRAMSDSVDAFIESVKDAGRREDCRRVVSIMEKATGEKPKMWGKGMVGFGSYHYKYESGREGDMFLVGFAPRKDKLTLYVMSGFDGHAELVRKLGKVKPSGGCLHVKSLAEVDLAALTKLVRASVASVEKKHARA